MYKHQATADGLARCLYETVRRHHRDEKSMINNWTDTAIKQWKAEGIKLNHGTKPEIISNAERILEFTFPEDFKELYFKVDGFADWDWRPNMFSIWPIERILKEFAEEANKEYVGFADYLINSHQIGFIKSRSGIFILYGDNPDKVADSFSEAIQMINSDSEKIY